MGEQGSGGEAGGARLVSVSSIGHRLNGLSVEDPNFERRDYDKWLAYGQAKSANALFALQLDKLGGAAWQARKAKAKERLREMAEGLIKIAAARALKSTEEVDPPHGLFDEFCARFPYEETDDQLSAIADVLGDLGSGKPDRKSVV